MTGSSRKPPSPALETLCLHAGAASLSAEFGLNTPVVTSSAFDYRDGTVRYPRYHNSLNHAVVSARLAALEGAEQALVTASGMGAISAIMMTLTRPGDHVILLDGLYGGTMDLVAGLLVPHGLTYRLWDGRIDSLADCIGDRTRLVMVESPTNPLLDVIDLPGLADLARSHGIVSVIDNTFATPVLQQPLKLGFDLVVHSGTKYLSGHSDLLCGVLAGSQALLGPLKETVIRLGASLNGQDLALLERSLKTLVLRVQRQSENARTLADRLAGHPGIAGVRYPGRGGERERDLATSQMADGGGMLAFWLAADRDPARFLDALALICPAVSLGGVESTICQPALTSHARLEPDERARLGIDERLMRLSVGIEGIDDLWRDLQAGLEQAAY